MVELTILVLINRLATWGCAPVIASRVIAADAPTLLALVSDPRGQWRLVAGAAPLLRPHASVCTTHSRRLVPVRVQLRGRDVLRLTWIVSPGRGTSEVDIVAQFEARGILARLVLALGGRRWLRSRLEQALRVLARLAHDAAEDVPGAEQAAGRLTRSCRATGVRAPL